MASLSSALIATIIGTMAAIAMQQHEKPAVAPLSWESKYSDVECEIVTGISLMLAFIAFGISPGIQNRFNRPHYI